MSELRQDLVSGDWIIVAPERARRPADFMRWRAPRKRTPKATCPFEDLKKSGNWPPILAYPSQGKWQIVVIPNKYPALVHTPECAVPLARGPYSVTTGSGHHDLVVTRDHDKNIAALGEHLAFEVFRMLQKRYRMLAKDRCLLYTSTFFNWGESSGASLYHPHYQVLTLPIIPPDIQHSLNGSLRYYKERKKCVHCVMLRSELSERPRIIEENRETVALAPYVSRQPFEVRIFPRRHLPCFEKTPARDLRAVVATLQSVLRRVKKHLGDPDFNFFIHTAPLKYQKRYRYYHWHIEVIPKLTILGGFELSTGVDINVIDPDTAAAILRGERPAR